MEAFNCQLSTVDSCIKSLPNSKKFQEFFFWKQSKLPAYCCYLPLWFWRNWKIEKIRSWLVELGTLDENIAQTEVGIDFHEVESTVRTLKSWLNSLRFCIVLQTEHSIRLQYKRMKIIFFFKLIWVILCENSNLDKCGR